MWVALFQVNFNLLPRALSSYWRFFEKNNWKGMALAPAGSFQRKSRSTKGRLVRGSPCGGSGDGSRCFWKSNENLPVLRICRWRGRIPAKLANEVKTHSKNQWKPAIFENFHELWENFLFTKLILIKLRWSWPVFENL